MEIQELSLTCFNIGDDLYAVDIMRVKEIIRPQKLTGLPKAPPFVEGVINLRGAVIPVIDMRKRFGLPPREAGAVGKLLIVGIGRRSVGLVVDDVTEIISVPLKDIKPPPGVVRGVGAEYLIGVCLVRDAMVMLLNLDSVMSLDETQALDVTLPEKAA